jgi:AcrR family transcriptional regulator
MTPRKVDQPQLTRQQIIATTMRLIDGTGLSAFSFRRWGAAPSVDPGTIYCYVPSKAALFDLVVDEVLAGVDTSRALQPAQFEERLLAGGCAYREGLLRHPHVVPIVAVRPLRTPAQLRMIEAFSQIFLDACFSHVETLIALDVTGMTVLGLTNMYAAAITRPEYAQLTSTGYEVAADSLPPEEFPHLVRLLPHADVIDADLEFDRAMRALALGLQSQHVEGRLAPTLGERQAADAVAPRHPRPSPLSPRKGHHHERTRPGEGPTRPPSVCAPVEGGEASCESHCHHRGDGSARRDRTRRVLEPG